MTPVALEVSELWVRSAARTLVSGASLSARSGELVGIVGPSGSGKSTLLRATCGRLSPGLAVDVRALAWRRDGEVLAPPLLGRIVTHLPQEAGVALDPFRTVGAQLRAAAALAGEVEAPADWLGEVGFDAPTAERVRGARPHELSGGMAERAAVAVALARRSPALLLDEPTTGLDRSSRRVVLAALRRRADAGHLVLVVSHDRGAVSAVADRLLVFAHGRPEAA